MKNRLCFLFIGIVFLFGCDVTSEKIETDTSSENAVVSEYSEVNTMDDYLSNITEKVSGFGGYSLSEDGNLVILIKESEYDSISQSNLNLIFNELANLHPQSDLSINKHKARQKVSTKKVKYDFKELHNWKKKIVPRLHEITGISFLDIDEVKNKVVISTNNLQEDENIILGLLQSSNIPRDAILIEEQERIVITLESECDDGTGTDILICGGGGGTGSQTTYNLQSDHSTYTGGIQITGERGNNCTLGLNVGWGLGNTRRGFVTASHCTNEIFEVDYGEFYQGNDFLGNEKIDRLTWNSWDDASCNENYECRYSDTALIEYTTANISKAPIGTIAKPTSLNSIDLAGTADLAGYFVNGTISWPYVNMGVHKVGRSTGLTTGIIDKSCTDVFAQRDEEWYMFICVSRADYGSAVGDSGSPVITNSHVPSDYWVHEFEVMLAGFHLGGNEQNDFAVFSSPHYTTGVVWSSGPQCRYVNGWLNSELCDEPIGYGPYEVRHIAYTN